MRLLVHVYVCEIGLLVIIARQFYDYQFCINIFWTVMAKSGDTEVYASQLRCQSICVHLYDCVCFFFVEYLAMDFSILFNRYSICYFNASGHNLTKFCTYIYIHINDSIV